MQEKDGFPLFPKISLYASGFLIVLLPSSLLLLPNNLGAHNISKGDKIEENKNTSRRLAFGLNGGSPNSECKAPQDIPHPAVINIEPIIELVRMQYMPVIENNLGLNLS